MKKTLGWRRSPSLKRYHLIGPPLSFDNVGHTTYHPDLHLILQPIMVEAGTANHQVYAPGFQGAQHVDDRGTRGYQLYPFGIKADDSRQGVAVFYQL
jgi:hypothetical protein